MLSKLRWFFLGLRFFVPHMPRFIWIAFRRMVQSVIVYWRSSLEDVEVMAGDYMEVIVRTMAVTQYDSFLFWACFSMASLIYLVGWFIQAWLVVHLFRFLAAALF